MSCSKQRQLQISGKGPPHRQTKDLSLSDFCQRLRKEICEIKFDFLREHEANKMLGLATNRYLKCLLVRCQVVYGLPYSSTDYDNHWTLIDSIIRYWDDYIKPNIDNVQDTGGKIIFSGPLYLPEDGGGLKYSKDTVKGLDPNGRRPKNDLNEEANNLLLERQKLLTGQGSIQNHPWIPDVRLSDECRDDLDFSDFESFQSC